MKKHIHRIIFLLTLLIGPYAFADQAPNQYISTVTGVAVEKQSSAHVANVNIFIQELFQWLNASCQHPELLTKKQVQKYFKDDLHYYINGKLMSANIDEFVQRYKKLRSLYKTISVTMPIHPITISGNLFGITYQVNKTDLKGKISHDQITAIAALQNGKIINWRAVISELS